MKKLLNAAFYAVLFFYALLMFDLLFRFSMILDPDREIVRRYNLIPFKTIGDYLTNAVGVSPSMVVNNLLGNVVVFIPCGLYLQTLLKDNGFVKNLLIGSAISLAAETAQFAFALGTWDVDDLILNTVGIAIGIAAYRLLRRTLRDDDRARTAVTILSLVVGVPVIALYFLMGIRIRG